MAKLPAGRLARHAYLDTLANARGLVRVGGPWLLLAWALLLLARSGPAIFEAAANLAITLGVAAIAVAWHRHILLGEPLTSRMAPVDIRVARYFMLTVLLAIALTVLPLLALMLLGGGALFGSGEEAAAAPEPVSPCCWCRSWCWPASTRRCGSSSCSRRRRSRMRAWASPSRGPRPAAMAGATSAASSS